MFTVRPVHPLLARLTCPLSVTSAAPYRCVTLFSETAPSGEYLLTTLLHLLHWNTKKRQNIDHDLDTIIQIMVEILSILGIFSPLR